jgi:hypothetical protein
VAGVGDSDIRWLQQASQATQVLGGCVSAHQFLIY